MSLGILLHSSPFVCRGRGKDINESFIDLTSLESLLRPHTCCLRPAGISSSPLLRMCSLETMRDAQRRQRSERRGSCEECQPEQHLHFRQDGQECSHCLVKMGSSSQILSTCRLNIPSRSIVSALASFWRDLEAKVRHFFYDNTRMTNDLLLFDKTMRRYVFRKFAKINVQADICNKTAVIEERK